MNVPGPRENARTILATIKAFVTRTARALERPGQPPANGWVFTKDKLPDSSGPFLVYVPCQVIRGGGSCQVACYDFTGQVFVCCKDVALRSVIAWRELPKGPEFSEK